MSSGLYIEPAACVGENCYLSGGSYSSPNLTETLGGYLDAGSFVKQQSEEELLKAAFQSMGSEQLKEMMFQFIQSVPGLTDQFFSFYDQNKSGRGLHQSASDWKKYSGFEGRNWSAEYSKLLESYDLQSMDWRKEMNQLSNDFFHAASLYAQVIISELPLPVSLKSIQPVNVGGIAGGDKYIVDNILFKFAADSELAKSGIFMYGGDSKRDDLAMKAASIEMRNMQIILSESKEIDLFVPLMSVIDFQGHRIIASSILPINDSTLSYGSADAGVTVHNSNNELNNLIETLGKKLNLSEHLTGSKIGAKKLYMPGDIEVHHGADGKFYILDVARLMPPEAPISTPKFGSLDSRKIFYQTLRPELVKGYKESLSSDAFSGWAQYDTARKEHEEKVQKCSNYLRDTIIPKFSSAFENFRLQSITYLPSDKEKWMTLDAKVITTLLNVADMSALVHYYGINVRHLGRIRSHLKKPEFRDFMLLQITARVMKNILREDMREIMKNSLGSPTDMPLRDLVLDTYSKIYSHCNHTANIENTDDYWNEIYVKTEQQFEGCYSDEEKEEINTNGLHNFLKERLDFRPLLYLFFKYSQVQLKDNVLEQLLEPKMVDGVCVRSHFSLVRADVEQFVPRVRKPFLSSVSTGLLLSDEADKHKTSNTNAYRLLLLAAKKMQAGHQAAPNCPTLNKELGNIYWRLGKLTNIPKDSIHHKVYAIRYYELAISESPNCEIKDKFVELLNETEQQMAEMRMCAGTITRIRDRNHDGLATCVSKRLESI